MIEPACYLRRGLISDCKLYL